MKDIEKNSVTKAHQKDLDIASELLLNGTPVIYVDGVKDNTRKKYLKFK